MVQRIKNLYHLFVAFLAHFSFGFPSRKLTVIGVTGTSGKTTTSHMIYNILKNAGIKVSLLSSINAVISGKELDTGFHVTTPDPHILPKYLKMIRDNGDTHVVLEVSSHGLDQNRAAFVNFEVGILTTLAHEHLDYHKTFNNYAKAKFKLLHASKTAVIPEAGISEEVKKFVKMDKIKHKIITFGIKKGEYNQNVWNLSLRIPGEYNLRNALSAAAAASVLGIDKKVIKKALENFSAIPGRFEEIKNNRGFRIIIDFAHKPDALEEVLKTARKEIKNKGRIIVLYGSAGKRDILKRAMMGEISGKLAEITVLADEDPRFENPVKILNEIGEGCLKSGAVEVQNSNLKPQNKHIFYKIPDRKEAIKFAIQKLAKKDDILLLCGKGHEKSQSYNGIETEWSEHKAVEEALK